jgi:hypothetical protein
MLAVKNSLLRLLPFTILQGMVVMLVDTNKEKLIFAPWYPTYNVSNFEDGGSWLDLPLTWRHADRDD